MAENTNVIKQIKVGTSDSIPIGVDWEHVDGKPTSVPWSKVDGKPTFTWNSTDSTLTITIP